MTESYELYEADREAFRNKLKEMSNGELLADLDDTIQIDMLKMSNDQWATLESKKVYHAIVNELRNRMR